MFVKPIHLGLVMLCAHHKKELCEGNSMTLTLE